MNNKLNIEQHKWEMLENIGHPHNPIMIKLKCKDCSCTFWYVCGTKLFDPGDDEAPPCKELDKTSLNP